MDGIEITRISETKRGRMALFSGDEFLFSLDEETWHFNPVQEGEFLSFQRLEELRQQSDTRKAKEKALEYLGMRPYGSRELYDKLCLKYDPHSAAAAVARMAELELLDDRSYALAKASALLSRNKSRREIAAKLAEKGVDREIVQDVLEELFADEDEAEQVLAVIEKSYTSKLLAGKRQNVFAALARRGFGSRAIQAALEEWFRRHEIEDEGDSWEEP